MAGSDNINTPDTASPERAINREGRTASAEDLVEYLEDVSGKTFYTRQDLHRWITEMRESRKVRRHAIWLVALMLVFLQYQVIDIMIEVYSLRSSSVVPASSRSTGYRS